MKSVNFNLIKPLQAATIAIAVAIALEIWIDPEKSETHNHIEQEMPIQKWHIGSGEFNVSGSTIFNQQKLGDIKD